ncbi:Transcriptional repressor TraM [Agrobacterium tumefaciens str. Kerr 14]|uniref:Transcriptional repressor TraM n=1 Tax=Agrobacterium tumefaciens str. Kerr 14 TaxID=1183424 RepID=A0A1S7SC88_AGRTU|nr:transcriptional repressor TraM [Agrobacterium tumefaciens]CUX66449.1 Transcriptional repressor TraM [Agrobacterium tumefaciens str. Kerr 14]
MDLKDAAVSESFELRPVIGLTSGLTIKEIEALTINAIRQHRELVDTADRLYNALSEDYKTGAATGGQRHLEYIEAMIGMHTQMCAVNTLVKVLGYIPKVSLN